MAAVAEKITGRKEALPVLACILFEAKKGGLFLRATNLETGVEVHLPADVAEKGTAAVPAHILSQTLRSFSGDTVTLELEEGNLVLKTKSGTTTIKTIPAEEFPRIPRNDPSQTFSIPRRALVDGIQAVAYAASQSLIRPELASIYLYHEKGALVFVATDSFRLAEKRIPVSIKGDFGEMLIPVKNALELLHVLTSTEEEVVSLSCEEAQLTLSAGPLYFVSRVVDASFPNYQEIIPKKFVTEATVLKSDFQSATKKARVFSNMSQQVSVHVYPKKKMFSTTARNADIGETDDTIQAAATGEDIDINFNLMYLADCLQSLPSESITLQFSGQGKPLVIVGAGDQSFRYLVMPLNR